ncbi:hypothetical protein F4212_10590 [Candidatus Poribacteria bacterium]|nr:hypothetical protein [Candidatus Poribacteria bacterium]
MRKCLNIILGMLVILALLSLSTATQAEETVLRWKNGDSLTGKLMESKSGKIRWKSPYFTETLDIDINVLDSLDFSKQDVPVTGAFRIGTVSGAILTADIIGSDENSLIFSSERYGTFPVNRELIYSLENREHANLIFDGSQLAAWDLSKNETKKQPKSTNTQPTGWYAERGGQPRTDQSKTNIFYPLEWDTRFEIDLELTSTTSPPGFVFSLGKNLYEALRVETWARELVVVQGTLFEKILTIKPHHRNFRLRLAYDQETRVLKVFDVNGNLLLKLDDVSPTTEVPGIYIYNRGQDLTVKRLRVYRQPHDFRNQQIDFSIPRIHMMSGEVFHGKLFVENGNAYVTHTDGTRSDINLLQIDRVVQPGRTLTPEDQTMELAYIDGTVISGQVQQINTDSVVMQTSFADQPITCSLKGASLLRLGANTQTKAPIAPYDKMFFPSGSLRGQIIFHPNEKSSIKWQPVGTSKPINIANNLSPRIERDTKHLSRLRSFDIKVFPHLLHLKNGEVIPCRILTYDETSINLRSPFITETHISTEHIKGVEFSLGKTHTRRENRNPITITGGNKHRIILEDGRILEGQMQRTKEGNVKIVVHTDVKDINMITEVMVAGDIANNDAAALKRAVELLFDPLETKPEELDVNLERALTVPRFNRDNPPKHILVGKNGDLKRGKLISFNEKTIQFESRLKTLTIPIERVARIVDISVNDTDEPVKETDVKEESDVSHKPDIPQSTTPISQVRFALIHNPILIFEPLEVKGDKLFGHSDIYGDVSVPVNSIQYIHFGEKAKSFKSVFENWAVRQAKEPNFGEDR